MLEFAVRTSLIAAAAAAALWALRIRAASAQHAVWSGVMLTMLVLPAWTMWGPKASLPVLPAQPVMVIDAAPVVIPEVAAPMPARPAPMVPPESHWNWDAAWIGLYWLGAGALLLRLAIGTLRSRRLTSAAISAPVTVGFFLPRVLLPESSREWPQEQLEAVMAHERSHVRRRDPVFQWLALFNRAVFWFHPLAWWLERRLSALAEEACDAAVLESGYDPREYSLLLLDLARTVERAGTRANVVATAMPGVYLPQRIKNIAAGVRAPRVSRTRLACAAIACAIPAALFAAGTLDHAAQLLQLPMPERPLPHPPLLLAQAAAPARVAPAPPEGDLKFEAASVRAIANPERAGTNGAIPFRITGGPGTNNPEHVRDTQAPMMQILAQTFFMQVDQFVGPDWAKDPYGVDRFEIVAKVPAGATGQQVSIMMQNLLKERFHMAWHVEKRNLDVYELVLAKNGPKLQDAEMPAALPAGGAEPTDKGDDGFPKLPAGWRSAAGAVEGTSMEMYFPIRYDQFLLVNPNGVPLMQGPQRWRFSLRMIGMPQFTQALQRLTEFAHIVDHTGLTGKYDIKLAFSGSGGSASRDGEASDPAPNIFEALEKQLGLKLQKTKAPLDVIVIERIDRTPTED